MYNLPCTKNFQATYIKGLRLLGLKQAHRMCRAGLPEEVPRKFLVVERRVDRGEASRGGGK